TQKRRAGIQRGQDAGFAFAAQLDVEIGFIGDITYERLRLVRIEIVHHEVPLPDTGVRVNGSTDMGEKIRFVTGRTSGNLAHPPTGHVKVDDEGEGAVPLVLELPAQDVSRLHGQIRVFAGEGLYACHFVGTQGRFSTLRTFLSRLVQRID